MVLYETKVLLVCFICYVIGFCSTDERTSVLAYDKGKPVLLLQNYYIMCIPIVVCLSEIVASESSSNLIQHAVLYFHIYTGY